MLRCSKTRGKHPRTNIDYTFPLKTDSHLGGHGGGPNRWPKFHNLCPARRVNDGIDRNVGLVVSILCLQLSTNTAEQTKYS